MLANKYRPKNFADLVGQDAVRKSLSYALESNTVAQAFLFSGLRGSGKTTSARILARCLNCEQGISTMPCMQCENCLNSFDIYELDAASNRGIDAINELIESTKYAPLKARFKIYIIDEVHMLTKEAFNALLKTLEEPPSYVKFILATTDANKLPATILSRVLHFRFNKIPTNLIASRLAFVLENEGLKIDQEALNMLSKAACGSLRDALTLLDQALIYCAKDLSANAISTMLGLFDSAATKKLLRAIAAQDESGLAEFLNLAANYESTCVLDEIKNALKESFFAGEGLFDLATFETFFAILARTYKLASTCDDDEFALSLCVLSMFESAFASKENSSEPKAGLNDAQRLFSELIARTSQRDAQLGQMLAECAELEALDDEFISICITPKNPEQAQIFKENYSLWWREFAKNLTKRALKISSNASAQNMQAKSHTMASNETTPLAATIAQAKQPEPMSALTMAQQQEPLMQNPTNATHIKLEQSAASTNYSSCEPVIDNKEEPELPSYQIDEFEGTIDDDEPDLSDLATSEQAFANMSDEFCDLIMSYSEVEACANEVIIWVYPPENPSELNAMRAATLAYLANLRTLYSQPVSVKKKLN